MSPHEIITGALDRYERPLISYAKEITGDLEAAKDAVQETFLRLSRQDIQALEPRLAPWLFLVCRNCALDHVRKILRFAPNAPMPEEEASGDPSPSESIVKEEDKARIRAAVAKLPEQQRELVRLKFDADLNYREMSEALEISISHVGVQLHDAMKSLRKHLGVNLETATF